MTRTGQRVPTDETDEFIAGDSSVWTVRVTEGDSETPKSLASATATFALATYQGGETVLTKSTTGGGVQVVDPIDGVLEVRFAPEDTADLSGDFYFELEVEDDAGDVATVVSGYWEIEPDTA